MLLVAVSTYFAHTPQHIRVSAQLSMLLLDVEALAVAPSSPRVLALNITHLRPSYCQSIESHLRFIPTLHKQGMRLQRNQLPPNDGSSQICYLI